MARKSQSLPPSEIAAAYLPVVRGYFIATTVYYCVVGASHPFFETGLHLLILASLAAAAAIVAFGQWLDLRRRQPGMLRLETGVLAVNALFLGNVIAYLSIHFEPLKLFYFVLLAMSFATAAPSRRVAYVSVAAAGVGMLAMARNAPGDLINQYAYVGLAGGFAAIGMATLMRGAVLRELSARLASEALNHVLEGKLEENERLRATAQALAATAQAASRAKTEFLATMSHEIRTPLNGVLGMSQVMERNPLREDQRERLAVIRSSADTLLEVVNAVLDISKIEAGKMEIAAAAFSLDRFAEAIERLYRPLALERGLTLSMALDPAARGWRSGDEVRLRQVLSNLISNALKFTDVGSVEVSIAGDRARLRISVRDTGIGIPSEMRDRVFEKFSQADGSTTRRAGGTGLGLAICREIVVLLGGAIGFRSAPGNGTLFEFQVPFAAVEAPAAAPLPEPAAALAETAEGTLRRLLVVDDNATNRAVLQALLSPLGALIELATQGREAVAAWEGGRWDAILMDIHMPEMDGLEASRAIRAREAATGRPRTPIIAVTASVLAHETQDYFNAGMDGVVGKPVEFTRLIEALQATVAAPAPPQTARAQIPR